MRLNTNGSCQLCGIIALAAIAVVYFAMIFPRSNEPAEISVTAAKASTSEHEVLKIRKGETLTILGSKYDYPNKIRKDSEKEVFLLVQNAKGERDFVPRDVISEERFEELKDTLQRFGFSYGYGILTKKTMSIYKFAELTEKGMTLAEIEKNLNVVESRIETTDGYQRAVYDRIYVFDKKYGKFYAPEIKYKNGIAEDIKLINPEKPHMNAWLLKFLPAANWIYDHNIHNLFSATKPVNKIKFYKETKSLNAGGGFWGTIIGILGFILVAAIVVLLHGSLPIIVPYSVYSLFIIPLFVKPFGQLRLHIFMILVTVLAYYYWFMILLPYAGFWLIIPLMYLIARVLSEPFLSDAVCPKCHFFNSVLFDHEDFYREYDSKGTETKETLVGRETEKWKTGTRVTEQTISKQTGAVLNERSHDENVKDHTRTTSHYRNDVYDCTYHVKEYTQYYVCDHCGYVETRIRRDKQKLSSEYRDSYSSTSVHET